ncbi:cytochrome c-type biogenesis protein [Pyruvatibacter mobilis]|uniref:cytochrome c-type biogenesis protein n=1 Tax=Pyruvatibacter mobilis TaxID=1712261 RepID=UPI003C7BCEAB
MIRTLIISLLALSLMAGHAAAYEPSEVLDDPALETRARTISAELRCMVCQNQSIDDSNAPLAKDLRILVRDRLLAGDTDEEVIDFVVDRYGEYVLLRPRVAPHTYILWFGPFIVLLLAGLFALRYVRTRSVEEAAGEGTPLTEDERARVDRLLGTPQDN